MVVDGEVSMTTTRKATWLSLVLAADKGHNNDFYEPDDAYEFSGGASNRKRVFKSSDKEDTGVYGEDE